MLVTGGDVHPRPRQPKRNRATLNLAAAADDDGDLAGQAVMRFQ